MITGRMNPMGSIIELDSGDEYSVALPCDEILALIEGTREWDEAFVEVPMLRFAAGDSDDVIVTDGYLDLRRALAVWPWAPVPDEREAVAIAIGEYQREARTGQPAAL